VGPVDPKAALLSRIRAALGSRVDRRPRNPLAEPDVPPAGPGAGPAGVAGFREQLEAQGGTVLEGPVLDPLLPDLAEALRREGVAALLSPKDDGPARAVAEALVPFGPFAIAGEDDVRQAEPPVTAGIQSAESAVAETGTIVQTSRGGRTLLPGLLTDVHVALLSPDAVVPRLEDALGGLAGDPPRAVSLITGPSRTDDIEMSPTAGVLGPRKVIAVITP
jgi:L-lactate dehydrogenase complex protein LldG